MNLHSVPPNTLRAINVNVFIIINTFRAKGQRFNHQPNPNCATHLRAPSHLSTRLQCEANQKLINSRILNVATAGELQVSVFQPLQYSLRYPFERNHGIDPRTWVWKSTWKLCSELFFQTCICLSLGALQFTVASLNRQSMNALSGTTPKVISISIDVSVCCNCN